MLTQQAKSTNVNPFAPPPKAAQEVVPLPPPAQEALASIEVDAPPSLDDLVAQLLQGDPSLAQDGAVEAMDAPRGRGGPGRMPGSPNKRKVLRYTHKALADAMILNPNLTGRQLAEVFGRSPQWVYLVQASDAFQAYLAQRQAEILDPSLRATLAERAKAVALRSMEVMQEKLERPVDAISDNFALRAFELSAKATALGGNAPPPAPARPEEFLPELAKRLTALRQGSAEPVIDVPSREVTPQE